MLAELLQAEWPRAQVSQLFADLDAGAAIEHVQLRTRSADKTTTLAEAERAFDEREAIAIQIRYRFEGECWSDTLMPGSESVRILRSRLPRQNGAAD